MMMKMMMTMMIDDEDDDEDDDDDAPLSSQPLFLKVWVHGKFHHRVSREGLGTLEM